MNELEIFDSYGNRVVVKRSELNDLKRQLEEARDEVETYKYDLETLVNTLHDCLHNMSQEECFDTLKQVDDHYKQLKEKGE